MYASEGLLNSSPNPIEVVALFLEGLPATISANLLFYVFTYALDRDPSNEERPLLLSIVVDSLRNSRDVRRMSVTLRVIGALDYLLYRSVVNHQRIKAAVEIHPTLPQQIRDRLLARALEGRHGERALAEWEKLRATSLSRDSLLAYEGEVLRRR